MLKINEKVTQLCLSVVEVHLFPIYHTFRCSVVWFSATREFCAYRYVKYCTVSSGYARLPGERFGSVLEIWNDCFRQIFAYQRHEFVKELQYYCNELPFEYMYDLFRWKFLTGVLNIPNRLSVLYEYKSGTVNSLNNKYGFIMSVKDWRLSITLQPR